jgi:hypothetical protein
LTRIRQPHPSKNNASNLVNSSRLSRQEEEYQIRSRRHEEAMFCRRRGHEAEFFTEANKDNQDKTPGNGLTTNGHLSSIFSSPSSLHSLALGPPRGEALRGHWLSAICYGGGAAAPVVASSLWLDFPPSTFSVRCWMFDVYAS